MMIQSILCFRCFSAGLDYKGLQLIHKQSNREKSNAKKTKNKKTNIQIGFFFENGLHRAVVSRNMYRVSSLVCYGM